ncbi:armadillo-type protein [Gilbertella persicaria]|uniref:armadillo-type protein n=1 Tax=Gilbertella persicaria TaxID=101096 RepID=UPI00221E381E|nr:armadillo-type protein [Gilbertella persicaria]KAI8081953.1 armadillo-type protein [Gilbertella persicaria]
MDYHARMGLSSLWKMQLDTLHDDLADSPSAEPSLSLGDSELLANMLHHNPGYQADIESNQANSFIPIPTRSVSTSTMANSQLNVSRSLWIGNMDGSITMDDLTSLFSFYGPIESIRLLLEKECAFINFFHVEDAVRAKEDVLTNLGGRIGSCIIRIGYGRAENTLTPFSMHSPATTLIEQPVVSQPTRALWLGNLPSGATQSVLQNIFCSFGTIEFIRVLTQKNCAFVNFETVKSASTARDALLQHELSVKELWGIRLGFAKVPLSSSSTKTKPSVSYVDTSLEDENINQEIWIMMKELGANENAKSIVKAFQSFSYHESIPSVPEFGLKRKHDTVKLREIRKKLDTFTTKEDTKYADAIALDCMNEIAEICSDYIGNTVVQRLFEKCSENLKTIMLETIAPHLAALGVHKNGTWAAQKIIDSLTTPKQFQMVFSHIQPYVPPLLLDQFGNYVVQCCLRLEGDTQFIVNAMVEKCFHIAQGRFGARAIRGILEGDLMNPFQKIFVSAALLQNAVLLATHSNGALLISWFMDCRLMENRHKLLASQLSFNLAQVATHKLGSQILLRLVNQNIEIKAKQYILNELHNQETLKEIVSDHTRGLSFVLKVLSSEYTTVEEKADLKAAVCPILKQLQGAEFRKALVEISALKSVKTVQ